MKKLTPGTRLVIGKNSVKELIRWSPERVECLLATQDVSSLEGATSFEIRRLSNEALSSLAQSDSHQGLAAVVREREKIGFKERIAELAAMPASLVVVLAEVEDPHHLGAIFRASEVFGVDLLIWSARHSPGVTASVTKVAVGATELVPYCEVANTNDGLRKLKDAGYWIVAASSSSDNKDSRAKRLSDFEFLPHTVIVFGGEGSGIPRLTLELCDFVVSIEQSGKIDSLSLSQAAAIFLHEAQRQRRASIK